jgi:hypothetical protein
MPKEAALEAFLRIHGIAMIFYSLLLTNGWQFGHRNDMITMKKKVLTQGSFGCISLL